MANSYQVVSDARGSTEVQGRARRSVQGASLVIAVVALVAVAVGCGSSNPAATSAPTAPGSTTKATVVPVDEGTPKDGGKLAFGLDAEPDGFNPFSNQFTYQSHLVASSMLETLATFDRNGNPQPYLAESIVPTNLAVDWRITLKPNITFQDGAPLDAAAVKANVEAFRKGISSLTAKTIDTVTVVDDRTIDIHMNQPWAGFAGMLASQLAYQISPATIDTDGATDHPVGTGPFMFDHWDKGTAIQVKRNPHYWQAGQPHLDAIEFQFNSDPVSRANALAAGDLDMITTDQAQTIADFRSKPGFRTVLDAAGDARVVSMNQSAPPFDNVNARKAVIQATDSKALTETIGSGVLKPTDQPFAEGSPYHQDDPHYLKFDLEAAKKASQQYTTETGQPLQFSFTVWTGTNNLVLAQALQEQWAKAGVKADITTKEQTAGINDMLFGKAQMWMEQNFGYPDPDWNFIFWHSSYAGAPGTLSVNFPRIKSDALDKTLVDGRVNLVPAQRQEAYKDAVRQLNDNFTYDYLYRYVGALITVDRVHGLKHAEEVGFSGIFFKDWYGSLWVDRQ